MMKMKGGLVIRRLNSKNQKNGNTKRFFQFNSVFYMSGHTKIGSSIQIAYIDWKVS
jgi:hypothetical protein